MKIPKRSMPLLALFHLSGVLAATTYAKPPGALPLDKSLIALESPEGQRLLWESTCKESFLPLIIHFATQDNLGSCGVASCTMVLNALPMDRPVSPEHAPFRLFTQSNFFTPAVRKLISPEDVRDNGMSLDMLADVLRTYAVVVDFAGDTTLDAFRNNAIKVLSTRHRYLLINYLRKAVKQESGWHIGPVAAYHERADRFLILDVARFKYSPVWVKAAHLWQAMRVADSKPGEARRYVIVRPAPSGSAR